MAKDLRRPQHSIWDDQDGRPAALAVATTTRLMFASRWAVPGSAVEEMLARRRQWVERTNATGVRTALLYASGWLLQWHEGTAAAVDAEWQRALADPQCEALRSLHCSEGRPALAEAVQVASLHAGEASHEVELRFQAVAAAAALGNAEPTVLWAALSAPRAQAAGSELAAPRELLALVSEGDEAAEAVRLLAQASGERVVYQRYAGSELQRSDVGAAYLDVPMERSALTRVHALPRRALAGACPILGLRNAQCLVLLLGSHPGRARPVVLDTLRLLDALPSPPQVVVAGRCAQVRAMAEAALGALPGLHVSFLEIADGSRASAALVWQLLEAGSSGGRWAVAPGELIRACAPAGTAPSRSRPRWPAR